MWSQDQAVSKKQVQDSQQGDIWPEGQVRGGLRKNCYIWQSRWPLTEISAFVMLFVCTSCISFLLETTECLFPLNSRGSGRLTLHCGPRGWHIIQTWHRGIFMSPCLIISGMGMWPKMGHSMPALGILLSLLGKKYSFCRGYAAGGIAAGSCGRPFLQSC